jgi:hypothetical protein
MHSSFFFLPILRGDRIFSSPIIPSHDEQEDGDDAHETVHPLLSPLHFHHFVDVSSQSCGFVCLCLSGRAFVCGDERMPTTRRRTTRTTTRIATASAFVAIISHFSFPISHDHHRQQQATTATNNKQHTHNKQQRFQNARPSGL